MNALAWDIIKTVATWVFSLRVKRCVYCENCNDCKASYRIPGPGGRPVPVCKHCIPQMGK